MLCVLLLGLMLSHNTSTGGKNGSQPQPYNITNITNPATTIGPTTTGQSTTTTTQPQTNQSGGFNYSQYIQQQNNQGGSATTTILYVYCVGSPTPYFNQSYYSQISSTGVRRWDSTTGYPIPFLDGACASSGSYVYCLGDSGILFNSKSRQAYYAPISQKGIGTWAQTTSYPTQFNSGSCSIYHGYIYCVGTQNTSNSNKVFYAPVSASGIGTWVQTTSYPTPFYGGQCNAYNGYIYCTGDTYINASALAGHSIGANSTLSSSAAAANALSNAATSFLGQISPNYYAQISSSGVGQWKAMPTAPQPLNGGSCTISNATIYCVGGNSASLSLGALFSNYSNINALTNTTTLANSVSASSYASLINASGLTAMLSSLYSSSASSVFYAPIAANGLIGKWSITAQYPTELQGSQCTSNGRNIFCIGNSYGDNPQQVYYAGLSKNGISGWIPATDYPIPFYSGYCSTNANA
ncbi:MAG: hypothetical protein KGH94_03025 [Candidatus Micrarchaeota archaeon]|nr:hypothetical protein [Candidatus Micrarchaeota archaeon]